MTFLLFQKDKMSGHKGTIIFGLVPLIFWKVTKFTVLIVHLLDYLRKVYLGTPSWNVLLCVFYKAAILKNFCKHFLEEFCWAKALRSTFIFNIILWIQDVKGWVKHGLSNVILKSIASNRSLFRFYSSGWCSIFKWSWMNPAVYKVVINN